MKISVCPGSFDPITYGHVDIIKRASDIFDHVFVAVLNNREKQPFFTIEERLEMIRYSLQDLPNITVECFDGLVIDYARQKGALAMVRGLRAVTDFEYEFKLAAMNRNLEPNIETVFMMTSSEYSFLSSSAVKEVASFEGDVSKWVSDDVAKRLYAKFEKLKEAKGSE